MASRFAAPKLPKTLGLGTQLPFWSTTLSGTSPPSPVAAFAAAARWTAAWFAAICAFSACMSPVLLVVFTTGANEGSQLVPLPPAIPPPLPLGGGGIICCCGLFGCAALFRCCCCSMAAAICCIWSCICTDEGRPPATSPTWPWPGNGRAATPWLP